MPAFASITETQAADLISFVRSNTIQTKASARSYGDGQRPGWPGFLRGRRKCATCHSVTGDLKGVGTKYDPMTLQGKIVWPRGGGGFGRGPVTPDKSPITVAVTKAAGEKLSGVLVSSDDFIVVLRDSSGAERSVARTDKTKVEMKDPLRAHFDNLRKLTDKQMHDLTAYLVTLK
jgi:hypothetical protein